MPKKLDVPQHKMLLRLKTDDMLQKDWCNAIAQHYNVSFKTAQRWIKKRGYVKENSRLKLYKPTDNRKQPDTPLFADADVVYKVKLYIALKTNGLLVGDGVTYYKQRLASIYDLRLMQERFSSSVFQFILKDYLIERPSDELDMLQERLTESKHVVILVFPGHLTDFEKLLQICTDYDNLLALDNSHYMQYKTDRLELSDAESDYINHKINTVIKRYDIDVDQMMQWQAEFYTTDKYINYIERLTSRCK